MIELGATITVSTFPKPVRSQAELEWQKGILLRANNFRSLQSFG